MIDIRRYQNSMKDDWDRFVDNSKNAPFFVRRTYMDYHRDRFWDHSLLFYHKGKLVALLPGNESPVGDVYYSHQGLSFAGIITDQKMKTPLMLNVFDFLLKYLIREGFRKFVYKPSPHIYHKAPAEEDLYALYLLDAKVTKRNPSSVIDIFNGYKRSNMRSRSLKKNNDVICFVSEESLHYSEYWLMLEKNLSSKYSVFPVHSFEEITKLKEDNPDNIYLCLSVHRRNIVAGIIIYESPTVSRCQYIASNKEGREIGAVDHLVKFLCERCLYLRRRYFDFGVSQDTKYIGKKVILNFDLVFNKESYGARTVLYDTLEVDL